MALFSQTATQPAVGDGSEGNPYEIASLENLYWLQVAGFPGYAKQTTDIDASGTATWFTDGEGGYYGWPAGTCNGNYDGQGYAIDGLYIHRTTQDNVGLFGQTSGTASHTITGIRLTNADITGNDYVGGIAGLSMKSNISDCFVSGSITGNNKVGGVAGWFRAEFGTAYTLQESFSSAAISGVLYIGGLVGSSMGATSGAAQVVNCYADGAVTSIGYGGGLIGSVEKSFVLNSYSRGAVSGSMCGGLIASGDGNEEGASMIFSSYWDTETSGQAASPGGGTGYSTAIMQMQAAYSGWDFTDTWSIDGSTNDGYPYLQSNLPEEALPITLSEFKAVQMEGLIKITWRTESETDNARFLIYRDNEVIAWVDGAGTTTVPCDYVYTDTEVVPGMSYTYMLGDVSFANQLSLHENMAVAVTLNENAVVPLFELNANYPNPFNPSTTIPYTLSSGTSVNVSVYDIHGRLVRELVRDMKPAGHHEAVWDGKDNNGNDIQSGVYLSRITAGDHTASKKMLMIK